KEVFEFAEENRELFLVILGNNGSISIGQAFTKYIDAFICDEKPSKYLRYCMQFVSAGVSTILWLWLNEKERLPAGRISEVVSTLYCKGLENVISADVY
ncbi:MAG: TetR-like C-terminal domain-containing protein, partial [Acutalibacteraceae bacterium]